MTLTSECWRETARLYCTSIGADLNRYQVAVYEHTDKKGNCVHIYINWISVDQSEILPYASGNEQNNEAARLIGEHFYTLQANK